MRNAHGSLESCSGMTWGTYRRVCETSSPPQGPANTSGSQAFVRAMREAINRHLRYNLREASYRREHSLASSGCYLHGGRLSFVLKTRQKLCAIRAGRRTPISLCKAGSFKCRTTRNGVTTIHASAVPELLGARLYASGSILALPIQSDAASTLSLVCVSR